MSSCVLLGLVSCGAACCLPTPGSPLKDSKGYYLLFRGKETEAVGGKDGTGPQGGPEEGLELMIGIDYLFIPHP